MSLRSVAAEVGVSHVALIKAMKTGQIKATSQTITTEIVRVSEWYRNYSQKSKPVTNTSETVTDEQKKQKVLGQLNQIKAETGFDVEKLLKMVGPLRLIDKNDIEKFLILERRRALEMDNEERQKNLLKADEVLAERTKMYSAIRSTLLLYPAKVAHRVAPITDAAECEKILTDGIREILTRLSNADFDE